MSRINLLGNKKEREVVTLPKIRFLRRIAIFLLAGISGASIILFLLISFSPLPDLQREEQQALSTISGAHPDIAKLFLVKDRLQGSSLLLKTRQEYDQKLLGLMEEMPPGITIEGMEMEQNAISLRVVSNSLTELDTFLTNLVKVTSEKKDYSTVTMVSLQTSDQRQVYMMTIRVGLL